MKKYTKIICMVAAVCLLGAAAFCGFRIYSHYAHESEQEEVFEKIAEVVEQAQTGEHSPTVIIAPITSRVHTKAKLPTHTLIKDFDGLDKNSIILFEQIRTIDKQRLREYLGTLDRRFIHCADKALAISIGLAKKD